MINPITGLPETPEEEQRRLQGMFDAPAPPAAPPMLATAPLPGAESPLYSGAPAAGVGAPSGIPASGLPSPAPGPPPASAAAPATPAAPAAAASSPKPRKPVGGTGKPDELTSIANERQDANRQMVDAAAASADNRAQAADAAAQALQAQQEQAARRQEAAKGEYDRLQGIAKEEDDKYKNAGFRDYWADKSTGTKALAAISMALGTLGQGLAAAGGTSIPNTALMIINQAIDRDWALQKERLGKLKEVAESSRADAHGAQLAWQAAEANTIARQKDALAAAADQAAAANGSAEARAKGAVISGQLRQDAMELRQKAQQANATLANTRADTSLKYAEADHARAAAAAAGEKEKPLTADQAKASDLAGRMLQDEKIIEKAGPISAAGLRELQKIAAQDRIVESNPKLAAVMLATGQIKTPENSLNDHDRLAYGARKRYAASVLRGDSGAAISVHEYLDFDRQNFGQIGDKDPDLEAKKLARDQQIQGKLRASGKAAEAVVQGVKEAPSTAGAGKVEQLKAAQDWLRNNPKDPRANAVRAKVTELLRGGL